MINIVMLQDKDTVQKQPTYCIKELKTKLTSFDIFSEKRYSTVYTMHKV